MAYSLLFGVALGAGNTGLTLEAQLKDQAGSNVGAAITAGFVEYGASGNYQWYTTAIPDGHIGGVVFQLSPGGAVKAFAPISPQETENTDVKTSTRLAPTVSGRTLDVTTTGEAGIDWSNVGAPTTPVNLSATQIGTVNGNVGGSVLGSVVGSVSGTVAAVVGNVGGNVVGSVGSVAAGGIGAASFAAGAIDAAAIATDAIGSAELAASAVTEIQSGLATSAALATVQADTDDIQARLPAALVSGRIDALVGAMAADTLTAAAIATDAIGAAELAASAVTEIQSGLATAAALATVQADTDDIQARLPAALVAGRIAADAVAISGSTTAADAVEANIASLDAAVSSRSSHSAAAVWAVGTRELTGFGTLVADVAGAVWVASGRTLSNFGTLVADVVTAVWSAVTRELTSAAPPTAAQVADAVWDETLADHLAAGCTGEALDDANATADPAAVAAAVWAYDPRTLTMSIAQIIALLDGTTMTITRGQTVSIPITGLGNITARTKLYLSVKDNLEDADTAAILQVEETAGLIRLNGAAGTAIQGSLTVTNATLGNVTFGLIPAACSQLPAPQNYRYDIRMIVGTAVYPLTQGVFTVTPEVTRAIT